jgi:hypothetical protein
MLDGLLYKVVQSERKDLALSGSSRPQITAHLIQVLYKRVN